MDNLETEKENLTQETPKTRKIKLFMVLLSMFIFVVRIARDYGEVS